MNRINAAMNWVRVRVGRIPWRNRWLRGLAFLLIIGTLLIIPLACTTTLVPPANVREPVTVFLLDHGRTPSLVLPDGSGGMVRYGYGDWDWYALRRTGALKALVALFWPTQGALGRLEMSGPPTEASIRQQLGVGIEHLHAIQVERRAVERLRERLRSLYQENIATRVVTESVEFAFVHHPESYTAFHNSNQVAAGWLEELGVEAKGPAFTSRWRMGRAPPRRADVPSAAGMYIGGQLPADAALCGEGSVDRGHIFFCVATF